MRMDLFWQYMRMFDMTACYCSLMRYVASLPSVLCKCTELGRYPLETHACLDKSHVACIKYLVVLETADEVLLIGGDGKIPAGTGKVRC